MLIIGGNSIGMLSCQQSQNLIDGKKRIILNPSEGQKRDFEAATFAEGEVYGIDILVATNEDGKVCPGVSIHLTSTRESSRFHLQTLSIFSVNFRHAQKIPARPSTNAILRSHISSK